MRLITSLLVIGCIASVAPGQWVEKTIVIPDSLGGLENPGSMLYNPGNDLLFIGCDNGVAVIDGISDRFIARTSNGNLYLPACYASQVNKVYWPSGSSLVVLDGATGHDLKHIHTLYADDICYNPTSNRVYLQVYDDTTVSHLTVIDPVGDSIVRTLSLNTMDYSHSLCLDQPDNKVYVLSDTTVTVVDCSADSITRTIAVRGAEQLVHNRVSDKLYCCGSDTTVTIIDCHGDSVLRRLARPSSTVTAIYNPIANKLYCADYDGVDIISGATDALLGRVQFPSEPTRALVDSINNLIWWISNSDTLVAIDGAGDSLCARVALGNYPSGMCYNPTSGRLYLEDAHVTVVDAAERRVDKRILLGFHPDALCWASSFDKLYCAGLSEASVAVVDGVTNTLRYLVPVGRGPAALAYERPLGLVCCANSYDSTVSIIDCSTDSVVGSVRVGSWPGRLCLDTILHKAWCNYYGGVAVVDLQAESVTAVIPTTDTGALLADPARARVYCAATGSGHVVVLDAVGDSIVANIPVGGYVADLSLNPGANLVYCVSQSNDAVAVIDGVSLRVTNIIPVGDYPQSLFYNERRNKLYCMNYGFYDRSAVTVIDCGTETPVDSLKLDMIAQVGAYDSNLDKLYYLGANLNLAEVVDCRLDSMVKQVAVGVRPAAAVYASSFRRMYVANEYGSSVTDIKDAVPAIAGADELRVVARPAPTIVCGLLSLPEAVGGERSAVGAHLLDISGRKVLDLHPGANDVRALAPGVYFVRRASSVERDASSVTKVVITR